MDYAGALLRGKGPSPAAPATSAPAAAPATVKPIARPTPAPIAPPKSTAAIPGSKQGLDPVECAGPFGKLLAETIIKIALAAGPAGLCNLGVSCKFLREKILTNAVWKQISDEVPTPKKPLIKFKVDFAGTVDDVEEAEDEAPEVKAEGKLISLVLSQVQRDSQRQKVVTHWLETVSQAQKARDVRASKADPSKDPLASKPRETLDVTLGGGIVIEQAGKGRNKRIYTSSNLADVSSWLAGLIALLQGSTFETLNLANGKLTLNRIGRGGTQIVVKHADNRAVFDFADFTNGVRKAIKEFVPFVAKCIVNVKQGAKSVVEADREAYQERSEIITNILKHQTLDRNLKSIKHYLETGTIPHSNLPALFAKKRQEKQRHQQQASIEFQGMLDFVLSNLPSDYEEAKHQAQELTENARQAQELARQKLAEEKLKAIEERKAKEVKVEKEVKKDKKDKKDKKIGVKTVDGDGWVSHAVVAVDAHGTQKPISAPAPAPVPAPAPAQSEGGKKKNKKGANKEAAKPAQATSVPAADGASKEYLDKNPYFAALHESSYESPEEIQYKKNMAKSLQDAPVKKPASKVQKTQPKPQSATQPKPPQAASQQKKSQSQKKEKKEKVGREDAKRAMSSKASKVTVKQDEWLAPVIVGVGAVLFASVAYFFLQGA